MDEWQEWQRSPGNISDIEGLLAELREWVNRQLWIMDALEEGEQDAA